MCCGILHFASLLLGPGFWLGLAWQGAEEANPQACSDLLKLLLLAKFRVCVLEPPPASGSTNFHSPTQRRRLLVMLCGALPNLLSGSLSITLALHNAVGQPYGSSQDTSTRAQASYLKELLSEAAKGAAHSPGRREKRKDSENEEDEEERERKNR